MDDLAKATFTNHLQHLKIIHLQASSSVFDESNSDFDCTGTKLQLHPFSTRVTQLTFLMLKGRCSLLTVFFASLGICNELVRFLESRIDPCGSQEDIFTASCTRSCLRVAQVKLEVQIGNARNVKLERCVVTSPQRVFWRSRDRVDEDLKLVEVEQGVRKILRGITSMVGGSVVDEPAAGGLRTISMPIRARGIGLGRMG